MKRRHVHFRVWSLLAVGLSLSSCEDRGSMPAGQASPPVIKSISTISTVLHPPPAVEERIRTDVAVLRSVPEIVAAPGEVSLDLTQVAKVTSRIEGQIEKVFVQLGSSVATGQPLVAVGGPKLDELIQEYLVSKAQADVAHDNLQRTQKLLAEQVVPQRRLVEDRGHYLESNARYQHAREKLLNMGMTVAELQQLEQTQHVEGHRYTIKSPIAGTVVAQHVVLGQGVASGIELFEIVDTSRVWIFANLAIEQARRLKPGDRGYILPKGADPLTAPLAYIAPLADEKTRTVQVRFDVANEDGRLKPQEFVEVQLPIDGLPAVAVPASAVTSVNQTRGVFVQRDSGYVFTPIEVAREGNGGVAVKQGLAAGDRVVVEGVFDLKTLLLKEHIQTGEGG